MAVDRAAWKSWKAHKIRSFCCTLLTVVCGAALLQLVSLIFNAQDSGKWGRGRDTPPSWVFSNYPWLWAVGLVSTVATAALLIAVAMERHKRASPTDDAVGAADGTADAGALEPN
ncbi:hypothetical protein AB0H92_31385 [Streptomyces phaeochromogenes]|uniref:hypothetical protein n=1 Tax=Streptomyces phaeochromogenes TaxID=1923 RepID=UPI0033C6FB0C